MKANNWIVKAIILGAVFFIAALVVKPVGVSTQFSVLSGIIHSTVEPDIITQDDERESGYKSTNAYYDKSEGKLAKSIKNPWNYDFVFVLAIPLGAYIVSLLTTRHNTDRDVVLDEVSDVHANNEKKENLLKKYLPSFLGGFLLLYGARMADGCTSGHMMSGMMQGSVSGYIFAASVFAVAIPTAIFVGLRHKKKGGD